jgi:hypothetical protein
VFTIRSRFVALAFTAAGLAACGDSRSSDAAQQELERDLQLASAATINLASRQVDSSLLGSMETQPQGVPEAAKVVKRGTGTRAVRSKAPTVMATPVMDVAASEESEDVQTESIAPAPEVTNEPVAVAPRPAPVVMDAGGAGDYGTGNGGGVFGGGRGTGVVIRGGGVDGDNCELHRNGGRRGGMISGPPIYIPQPNVPRTGGPGIRSRVPTTTASAPSRPSAGGARGGTGMRGRVIR